VIPLSSLHSRAETMGGIREAQSWLSWAAALPRQKGAVDEAVLGRGTRNPGENQESLVKPGDHRRPKQDRLYPCLGVVERGISPYRLRQASHIGRPSGSRSIKT
jgi:hypothetical protein